VKIKKAAENS